MWIIVCDLSNMNYCMLIILWDLMYINVQICETKTTNHMLSSEAQKKVGLCCIQGCLAVSSVAFAFLVALPTGLSK